MKSSPKLVLIAHNIRSSHNVGSLLRTAEGLGIECVFLTGYTPYPTSPQDSRMPHLQAKITKDISKTALGAENFIKWVQTDDISEILKRLRADGYQIIALEQRHDSVDLGSFQPSFPLAVVLGNEVEGVDKAILDTMDKIVEIPMQGKKESFNVVQAAAMACYKLLN